MVVGVPAALVVALEPEEIEVVMAALVVGAPEVGVVMVTRRRRRCLRGLYRIWRWGIRLTMCWCLALILNVVI